MGNIIISTAHTKPYANKQRTISNERYAKQTQIKANFKRSSVVRKIAPYRTTGLAGGEIATHSTAPSTSLGTRLRAGFLAMTIGRAVPLGLRRPRCDELLRGPFSPRRRSERPGPVAFYSRTQGLLEVNAYRSVYSQEPHTKPQKLFPLELRAKTAKEIDKIDKKSLYYQDLRKKRP